MLWTQIIIRENNSFAIWLSTLEHLHCAYKIEVVIGKASDEPWYYPKQKQKMVMNFGIDAKKEKKNCDRTWELLCLS